MTHVSWPRYPLYAYIYILCIRFGTQRLHLIKLITSGLSMAPKIFVQIQYSIYVHAQRGNVMYTWAMLLFMVFPMASGSADRNSWTLHMNSGEYIVSIRTGDNHTRWRVGVIFNGFLFSPFYFVFPPQCVGAS